MNEQQTSDQLFRILPGGNYVSFDTMTWPLPMDNPDGGLEWRLRYANPEQLVKDRYLAASVVSAYRELLTCPVKQRNKVIAILRRALGKT